MTRNPELHAALQRAHKEVCSAAAQAMLDGETETHCGLRKIAFWINSQSAAAAPSAEVKE